MGLRIAARIGAVALAVWGVAGQACTVDGDYFAPSNFELVQIADAIAIATPVGQSAPENPVLGSLTFRVDRAVKGSPPSEFEAEFAGLGPDGGIGMCNRSGFETERQYIAFLGRGADGEWGRLAFPFAPDIADYDGEDGAWTRTIRRYLALQDLPPMEQLAALARIAEAGIDGDGQRLSDDERNDILRHLRAISPWKPTPWLLDVFGRLERGEPLPFGGPEAPENGHDGYDCASAELLGEDWPDGSAGRALDQVQRSAAAGSAPPGRAPVDPLRLRVLEALVQGDHPDALPLFERLWAAPDMDGAVRGRILRYFAANGQFPRAYRWIETSLMAELRTLPPRDALALLEQIAAVQRGGSWEEGRERWRSDAHAAATWPALSRALYRYQVRTFGEDEALPFFDLGDDRR